MTEPKDTTVRVPATVARYGRRDYRAWVRRAAGPAVEGTGTTAAEAKAALVEALEWAAHVEPGVLHDAEGGSWLAYPWGPRGQWCVRRLYDGRLSQGATITSAVNWSALRARVAEWHKPVHAAEDSNG